MSAWFLAQEGTESGRILAFWLALAAAFLHAVFGAIQKGRHDPWITRGAIDLSYAVLAMPFALFVVPWPEPHMWLIFAGMLVIHLGYKVMQALAYSLGAFTLVYPVVRGTGPLLTVIGAALLFEEHFSATQWIGVAILLWGIFGLAVYNYLFLATSRETLGAALAFALGTGAFVALYTTYDAYGIRATANPFTFVAWFFFLDGLTMPLLVALRQKYALEAPGAAQAAHSEAKILSAGLVLRGVLGGLLAIGGFGAILLATRLDKVGQAAVLRETSTVFAALIGWLVLKESVGLGRLALMAFIAAGAVIVGAAG